MLLFFKKITKTSLTFFGWKYFKLVKCGSDQPGSYRWLRPSLRFLWDSLNDNGLIGAFRLCLFGAVLLGLSRLPSARLSSFQSATTKKLILSPFCLPALSVSVSSVVFWSAIIMLPSQSFMFHSDYSQANVFWDKICRGSPYGCVINALPFHVTFILKKLMSCWYFKPRIVLFISSVVLHKWKCQRYKTVTLIERMKTGVGH